MTKRFFCGGNCSSAAAILGGNDDLLTEILVLLPAKSVVRLKILSKHWLFRISDASFTRLHIQNNGRRGAETQHQFILSDVHRSQFFLCYPTIKKLVRVSLPNPIQRFEHVRLLQSSNGLLLLIFKFPTKDEIDYVVFNPTTKQFRFIHLDGYDPLKVCLYFDPSKSEYYKLVMITTANPNFFSVYDSATHQWSHGMDSPFVGRSQNIIMCSLILGSNSPNLVQVPEGNAYDTYIFESNEHLNMLQLKLLPEEEEENNRCFRLGVWIDDKWVIYKKAILDFDSNTIGLVGMVREERIEDSAFLFQTPGRILICKFSNEEVLDLEVLVDYRSDDFYVQDQLQFEYFTPFIHSFASV